MSISAERISLVGQPEISPSSHTLRGLLTNGTHTFQYAVEPSYAREEVFNPDRRTLERILKSGPTETKEMNILVGATADGRCPADCFECPYANSVMAAAARVGDTRFAYIAKPVTVTEHLEAIEIARKLAIENKLLRPDDKYKVAVLLSGDLGINPHIAELVYETAALNNCRASKWSTIAARFSQNIDVIEDYIRGAKAAMEDHSEHAPRLQVSLHSPYPDQRHAHVVFQAPHRKINLIPMTKIATAFSRIKAITGQMSSLSCVLNRFTKVNPYEIARIFPLDATIASYRPVYSKTEPPFPDEQLLNICEISQKVGLNYIYMPARKDPPELDNLRL